MRLFSRRTKWQEKTAKKWEEATADHPTAMIYVVTPNYEKMKQFFVDLGLRVDESDSGLQFTPGFNQGRGTAIYLDDMTVCLEEATDTDPSGALYFDVGNISAERIDLISSKYKVKAERGLFCSRDTLFIVPPDGGILTATKSEQDVDLNT